MPGTTATALSSAHLRLLEAKDQLRLAIRFALDIGIEPDTIRRWVHDPAEEMADTAAQQMTEDALSGPVLVPVEDDHHEVVPLVEEPRAKAHRAVQRRRPAKELET